MWHSWQAFGPDNSPRHAPMHGKGARTLTKKPSCCARPGRRRAGTSLSATSGVYPSVSPMSLLHHASGAACIGCKASMPASEEPRELASVLRSSQGPHVLPTEGVQDHLVEGAEPIIKGLPVIDLIPSLTYVAPCTAAAATRRTAATWLCLQRGASSCGAGCYGSLLPLRAMSWPLGLTVLHPLHGIRRSIL